MNDEDADFSDYRSTTKDENLLLLPNTENDSSFPGVEFFHRQEELLEQEGEEHLQEEQQQHEQEEKEDEQVDDGSIREDCLGLISSSLDLTDYFATKEVFDSKESVRNW